MSKFSLPNLIASTTLSGLLAFPALAAGKMPEEAALDAAMQAIKATMGAGNISAERLNADPMGIVKTSGTVIGATETRKGYTKRAQAFVTDNGELVRFGVQVVRTNADTLNTQISTAQETLLSSDDYSHPFSYDSRQRNSGFNAAAQPLYALRQNFQHLIDDYNTANIEVALHKAMKETLPEHALSWTNYDEKETNLYVRACGADKSCNQLQATLAVDPKTRIMSVSMAASSILPAATPNAEREVLTVTANMADVRDNQSIELQTDEITRTDHLVRAAALGGEAYMTLQSFLDAKRGIVTVKGANTSTTTSPHLCRSIIIRSAYDLDKIKANELREDNTLKVEVAPEKTKPFGRVIIPHRSLKY